MVVFALEFLAFLLVQVDGGAAKMSTMSGLFKLDTAQKFAAKAARQKIILWLKFRLKIIRHFIR